MVFTICKRIANYLALSVAEKTVSHTQYPYKNKIHCFQRGFFHARLHLDQHASIKTIAK